MKSLFFAFVASLISCAGVCDDIVWQGAVAVPAGADVTCSDHSAVTSLSIGEGATVRFDTDTAHAFPITGSGTIIKVSDSEWTMSTVIADFKGDYAISSGVVNVDFRYAFGQDAENRRLTVADGATLRFTSTGVGLLFRHVHIVGNGAPGCYGALEMPAVSFTEGILNYLYLDGDATLYTPKGGLFFIPRTLNLAGYRLVLSGAGEPTFLGCTFSEDGEVYLAGSEATKPRLYLRSWKHSDPSFYIPSTLGPFVMPGFSEISIWCGVKPIGSALYVSGTNNVLSHSANGGATTEGYVTNHANWVGPVTFTNETGMAHLRIHNGVDPESYGVCMICVSGPISGPGAVTLTHWWKGAQRVALLNESNSYTGGTKIENNAHGGSVLLGYPGSIPGEKYSSVTANVGYVDIAVADDYTRWDLDSALKFASAATLGTAKVRFSSEFTTNGLGPVKFKVEEGTPTTAYLGARDAVKFEGTGNTEPFPFNWNGGTAHLTGPEPILLGETKLKFDEEAVASNSAVRIEGADVTIDGSTAVYIGQDGSKVSRMVVSNSVVRTSNFMTGEFPKSVYGGDYAGVAHGTIMAGYYSAGILEVLAGSVITGRVVACGYAPGGSWLGRGQGAVYQRGGKMVAIGNSAVHFSSGVGICQAGCGYYELTGGTLEARGTFSVGGYSYGCFAQYGGTVTANDPLEGMVLANGNAVTARGLRIASCNGGQAEYYMEGGTFKNNTTEHIWIGTGNQSDITCNLTVNGPDALFDCGLRGVYMAQNASNGRYVFNFNAGTFACGGLRLYRAMSGTNPLTNNQFCVNFNGGTFRALDNTWTDPFCYGSTDRSLGPTNVAVYAGGAVIETDCTNVTFKAPFRGAWGKGIKSIVLSEPVKKISYVGSPRVEITGDGIGASAFAHFDSTKMEIDRIIVTSPGCGYTTAEVNLIFDKEIAKTLTSEAGEVVLEDNANTGSFTKTGIGSIRLGATNTWGGATIVKGGVVTAICDWALPTNTVLKLGGGCAVNLNGTKAKISAIEYLPGGGSVSGTANAEMPDALSMSIDLADIVAGNPIVLNGDVDLSEIPLTVTGDDFSALDKADIRYSVVTVTGTATGSPELTAATPPPRWSYVSSRKGVALSCSRGTVLLFR